MKAYIYIGGSIDAPHITEHPTANDLLIAADSGLKNALELKETPSIFVGDCDSFPEDRIPAGIEKMLLKPEKDATDTQVAIEIALRQGADDLVIIGGLDGRLDHTLSNLAILEYLSQRRISAIITDGRNRVRYLANSSTLIPRTKFKYLALITLDKVAKGVSIEGCKYPLKNAKIERNLQFAVSNEITGNCALVSVRKGSLFIIESQSK